jgi:periplasmic divalent cation tolerance protein
MNSRARPLIAMVTAPDAKVARALARNALKAHLVACANVVPAVESHYWWQGRVERAREVMIIFKTTGRKRTALERMILKLHPYDTPEFVVLRPGYTSQRYLDWWVTSCDE